MQSDLPQRLLLQFNNFNATYSPDWKEQASNLCLYFLRNAMGSDCQRTDNDSARIQLAQKTASAACRAFNCFVAFTLWLPLTLLGVVLCLCSKSHADAADIAQKILQNPPPTPAGPPAPSPLNAKTPTVTAAPPMIEPAPPPVPMPMPVPVPAATSAAVTTAPATAVRRPITTPLFHAHIFKPVGVHTGPQPLPPPIETTSAHKDTPHPGVISDEIHKHAATLQLNLKKIPQMSKEELSQHIAAVATSPSQFPLELKKVLIKACIEKCSNLSIYSADRASYVSMYPVEMGMIDQLYVIFREVSDQELVIYLPYYVQATFEVKDEGLYEMLFQLERWLTPHRYAAFAQHTAEAIRSQQLDTWKSWTYLLTRFDKFLDRDIYNPQMSDDARKVTVAHEQHRMLQETIKMLESAPKLLAECYAATPTKCFFAAAMTVSQIHTLTMELKRSYPPNNVVYLELVEALSMPELPSRRLIDIAHRIYEVPKALNQADPIKWIRQFANDKDQLRASHAPRTYLLCYMAYCAFHFGNATNMSPEEVHAQRRAILSEAIYAYADHHANTPIIGGVRNNIHFPIKLVELAATNYTEHFQLIAECLKQKTFDESSKIAEQYRSFPFTILQGVVDMQNVPHAAGIAAAAFAAILPWDEMNFAELTKVLAWIKSKDVLHGALDAAITAIVPPDMNHQNPIANLLLEEAFKRGGRHCPPPLTPEEASKTLEARRIFVEEQLKLALPNTVLPPELVDIVSSYYIALPARVKPAGT